MAGTYSAFKCNEHREQDGVTLDLGKAGKFKLARAGGSNTKFERRLMAITKPHRRSIQTGTIDKKLADKLLAEAFAETVVLGWEGVTDEKGEDMQFSKENAMKLFADLPDLFREIKETAEDASLFREEVLEGDAGNS